MISSGPLFQHGDIVRRRNRPDELGTIQGDARKLGTQYYYKVLFHSSVIPVDAAESDLEKFTFARSLDDLLFEGAFGDKVTFSRLMTYERLQSPLHDNLYALRASRTKFEPYQFKPLLKFLGSARQRLLLADEVGLGKTIEAGFVLSEILARHPHTFRRVLVICKASLCIKWQMELRRKFDLPFEIWRAERLLQFLNEYREDPDTELKAICSLESFRLRSIMAQWEEMPPTLDVLIIDEAHHLKNAETLSHRACRQAAEAADAVLALTATPIQIGSRDLFNVLALLDPEEFSSFELFEACMQLNQSIVEAERLITRSDPGRFKTIHGILTSLGKWRPQTTQFSPSESARVLVVERLLRHPLYADTLERLQTADPLSARDTIEIHRDISELNFLSRIYTRTRKRDVHIGARREASVLPIRLTPSEIGFYKAVTEYVRKLYERTSFNPALLFGLIMPQRQIASCIPAMVDYYRSELGEATASGGLDTELSDLDTNDWDNDPIAEGKSAKEQLLEIINRWYKEGAPDTKYETLRQCLVGLDTSQPDERVVIFSYFKKTLEYLSNRLAADGYSNTIISGAYTPQDREDRIARFRRSEVRVLLSSEVGSEGLDFQFCHILFNYDLPWNPMVVEQRIGRLDRYGQKAEKVQIFNLSAPGTIEDAILRRLYSRINIFESYIGDLEAILGDTMTELTRDLFNPVLTEAQRDQKIEHAALVLERQKQHFQEWETNSAQFVGQDEFYMQEIGRVSELGRYISGVDLSVFVEEFLSKQDSRSELSRTEVAGIFTLTVGDRLLKFLQGLPDDPQRFEFIRKAGAGEIRLTFDSEIAERDPEISFVHVRHFVVRGIVSYYRENTEVFHRVARITIEREVGIAPGRYLYLVARARIFAARQRNALLPVITNLESLESLSEDACEVALGKMIREGNTPEEFPLIETDDLQRTYHVAVEVLEQRFNAQKKEAVRVNHAMVDTRVASVQQSYESKLLKKRQLLNMATDKGRDQRYIRMLQGYIRNLEQERSIRMEGIEKLRTVTGEFETIAAGFLQIT
jgi:superfamily II DNA or RNA helicase